MHNTNQSASTYSVRKCAIKRHGNGYDRTGKKSGTQRVHFTYSMYFQVVNRYFTVKKINHLFAHVPHPLTGQNITYSKITFFYAYLRLLVQ